MNLLQIGKAFASENSDVTGIIGNIGPNVPEIPQIITNVLKFATGFAIIICVAILIFAGYTYMTAGGDEGKIQTATKSLTWAIIGLVLSLVAVMLIKFVSTRILGTDVTGAV